MKKRCKKCKSTNIRFTGKMGDNLEDDEGILHPIWRCDNCGNEGNYYTHFEFEFEESDVN